MFEGKKILITGGTGSLGQALTNRLLETNVDAIRIFSRNEQKQVDMKNHFDKHPRLRLSSNSEERIRYFIGDIRSLPRLTRAMENVDIVFHAAALKHVPVVEYNPFEAVETNVVGSQNVIDACILQNIDVAVGIGTDKAVSPLNAYGATKLLMEKLFVSANNYVDPKRHRTKFLSLRYGNVFGSSGSVIPKFIQQIKNNEKLTITDPNMTRFSITMDEALDFILDSISISKGSEIFIPELRAYTISDIKNALIDLLNNPGEEIINIRPGEKLHEILISNDEMRYTWKLNNSYIIFNSIKQDDEIKKLYPGIKKVDPTHEYSSHLAEKISKDNLLQIIKNSGLLEK